MVITVIVALLVGAGAFFGGMKYQESKTNTNPQQQSQNRTGNRQGPNGQTRNAFGRPVIGEVISLDDKSLTVKLSDGSSKIVLLPQTLTISKSDVGAKSDLKVGVKVGVFGTDNSDGSVTAQNVQINPMYGGRGNNRM